MCQGDRSGIRRFVLVFVALASQSVLAGEARAEDINPELLLPLGHTEGLLGGGISSVAISRNGKRILTGAEDQNAILWDTDTGKLLQIFMGHSAQGEEGRLSRTTVSVALSGDGKRALTGGDQTAMLWDADTGKLLQTFRGHTEYVLSVALSGDGKLVLTGSADKTAILWDAETGKRIKTFKGVLHGGHSSSVQAVAISRDGKRVLTGSWDATAILWDARTGKRIKTFKGNTGSIQSVGLSEDGKRVVTASKGNPPILWDAVTAKPIRFFRSPDALASEFVSLSEDGKRVLTCPSAILWDAETGKPIKTLQAGGAGALSADGKRVLTGDSHTARLWDANTGKALRTFEGHTKYVVSASLSRDGKRILTESVDDTAILWDVGNGKPLLICRGYSTFDLVNGKVALSGDGKRFLTSSEGNTTILWNADTGKSLQTFKGATRAMSEDGKRILTSYGDNTAILWDVGTGKSLQTFKEHTNVEWPVVALSGDGKRVLTASGDKPAVLWDAETAKPLQTFKRHTRWVKCVALSSDGQRILTGSRDKTAILWDANRVNPLQTFKGHTESVYSVALSSDGQRILTGSLDKIAILWDADTAKPLQTFKGHSAAISSVAFGPKDAFFVTASYDGTVRIWKPGREEPVFCFLSAGEEWLFWTPEGYYSCSPNGEDLIAWKVKDDTPQGYRIVGPAQFRKQFYRPDLFRHLLAELDLTKAFAAAGKESGRTIEAPTSIAEALPPYVIIAKPLKSREIIQTEQCEIIVKAKPVGDNFVTSMQLLVDGRPYQDARASFDPKAEPVSARWTVNLSAGKRRIQVVAGSLKGSTSQSEEIEIIREDEREAPPTLLLMGVGITEYRETDRKGAEFAADDAKQFLAAQVKHARALYPLLETIALTDGKATREEVLNAFDDLAKKARKAKNPVTIIFLAGHGQASKAGGDCHFLAADSDPDKLRATAISGTQLKDALKDIPGKRLIFLDACFSGAFAESLYWELKAHDPGAVLICSSRREEESGQSSSKKSGYFTLALVEGLSGDAAKDDDGAVNLLQLYAYVHRRVIQLSGGKQHPYTSNDALNKFGDLRLTKP
jgi:WD40 repeat protein